MINQSTPSTTWLQNIIKGHLRRETSALRTIPRKPYLTAHNISADQNVTTCTITTNRYIISQPCTICNSQHQYEPLCHNSQRYHQPQFHNWQNHHRRLTTFSFWEGLVRMLVFNQLFNLQFYRKSEWNAHIRLLNLAFQEVCQKMFLLSLSAIQFAGILARNACSQVPNYFHFWRMSGRKKSNFQAC